MSIASVASSSGALSESKVGALEMDEQVRFDFDAKEASQAASVESTHRLSS